MPSFQIALGPRTENEWMGKFRESQDGSPRDSLRSAGIFVLFPPLERYGGTCQLLIDFVGIQKRRYDVTKQQGIENTNGKLAHGPT